MDQIPAPNNVQRQRFVSIMGPQLPLLLILNQNKQINLSHFTKKDQMPQHRQRTTQSTHQITPNQQQKINYAYLNKKNQIEQYYKECKQSQDQEDFFSLTREKKSNLKCIEDQQYTQRLTQNQYVQKNSKLEAKKNMTRLVKTFKNVKTEQEFLRQHALFKFQKLVVFTVDYSGVLLMQDSFKLNISLKYYLGTSSNQRLLKQRNFYTKKILTLQDKKQQSLTKLYYFLKLMVKLKLTMKQIINEPVFPHYPMQNPLFDQFLQYTKLNKYKNILKMLRYNRYLVHQYDEYHMTALHWAAKRGNFETCYILLSFGADIDAIDVVSFFIRLEGYL